MIWVNVHFPDKLCTAHKPTCGHILQEETSLKGIREIRGDGGWYDFTIVDEAFLWSKNNYPHYEFKKCGKCKP
ncbi:hypothetical protein ACFPES_31050 [Paenibacillus sp. GCM10023248]|uniref:hypothetical protein n=1 Tax=unclassified Paenibacillus TaxID=185978 RepID=UPI00237977B8|nr:hypothetical protein [Paenibacillus sp. MAHUQ-63]MDD9271482.1 hypothetical protein [Paenibacillus sp. MAHUQ-63]